MDIATRIFKRKTYDIAKLLKYGFKNINHRLKYSTYLMSKQFLLEVNIIEEEIKTDIIDIATQEPFVLYHIENAIGSFVGQLRAEAEKVLLDIAENCFYTEIFKSCQAKMVINYIMEKYQNHAEYLWEKFPDNAIFRRNDNHKWYAAILTVQRKKLGLSGEGTIEIIDLREESEMVTQLLDNIIYFPGYHMNKKYWYTICLDDSVSNEEIQHRIDKSFTLTH